MDTTKSMTQSTPIAGNEYVTELLNILEANNMPGAKDLLLAINQVSAMEKHLSDMVTELAAMRRELVEAQKLNHPIKVTMQNVVNNAQSQVLELRDKISELKQDIISGCKTALEAFQDKGLSALRNLADFFKIRPILETMNKDIDKAINQNKTAIAEIEGISERYHKAGLHLHNTARVLAGKETIQEVKPMGKLAKAFIAPCHADICFLEAIKRNVNNAIRVIARLEKTERKPPIMETIEKFNEQIAQAQKDAPERERLRPAIHDGR